MRSHFDFPTLLIVITCVIISTLFAQQCAKRKENDDDYSDDLLGIFVGPCGAGFDCVLFYQCLNGTVNQGGIEIIIPRFGNDTTAANDTETPKCPCYLEVCCKIDDKNETPNTDGGSQGTKEVPLPTAFQVNSKEDEICGQRNSTGVGFTIVGARDNEAQYGEFPWMMAVIKEREAKDGIGYAYVSGGSLVHRSVVITAAHYAHKYSPSQLTIKAGEWDTQTDLEQYPNQLRSVSEIVVHENFNADTLYNDIALLFVSKPFDLAPNVRTVCLPPPTQLFDNDRCFVTGWGKDSEAGNYQRILKKIELPIVPRAKCQKNLRKTALGKYFQLHNSFICAGGEGQDSCHGDGGSPLVCPIPGFDNRYYQAGIVAWGLNCNEINVPAAYASISYLRPWIDEKLSARNIESNYYTPQLIDIKIGA